MKTIKLCLIALCITVLGYAQAQTKSSVTLEQFAAKLKEAAGNAQILDARSNEEFVQNHIQGAVNADAKAAHYQEFIDGLDKSKPTFVYSIANGRSSVLSAQLRAKGFDKVYELPGGLSNWVGSGYPIVSNTKKGVSLTQAQYNDLNNSSAYVLIDFGSRYCGACKKLIPVLDSLKANTSFRAKIISIEQYDNTTLARDLKVNILPTVILYKQGTEVWRKSGQSTTFEIDAAVKLAMAGGL